MVNKWKENQHRTLVKTHVFELQERRSVNPRTNEELPFFVLESSPWVNVIPLTDEGRVIMVRQYRQGTRAITLEIPGGMAEPDEPPEEGARRELLEETGYEAEEFELLGVVDTNPAIQSNATYTYLARGLKKVAEPTLDDAEDIEVLEVELSEINGLITSGEITHSLVIAAFYWFDRGQQQSLQDRLHRLLDELADGQQNQVAALAKRINAALTDDDLLSPHDFPELANDADFNYQDGMLAGIEAARMAFRRLAKES